MYGSNQTLKHKVTNELIALSDKSGSNWAWDLSGAINEKGELIPIDISDYEPILDWFGTPKGGIPGKDGRPDTSLKQYIVSDEVRKEISHKEMEKWAESNFKQMRQGFGISCYNANGSRQPKFRKHFLDKFTLYSLFGEFRSVHKGRTEGKDGSVIEPYFNDLLPTFCSPVLFEFDGKIWSLKDGITNDICLTTITVEQFEFMKPIMKIVNL
jgi:hypothetical protein